MKHTANKNRKRSVNKSSLMYEPVDRFFQKDFLDHRFDTMQGFTIPSINFTEEADQFRIEVAAPGFKPEDFNVVMEKNVLTISSEPKMTDESIESLYSRREYNYSGFSRSLYVPEEKADAANITSSYKDGILLLTIPKKTHA